MMASKTVRVKANSLALTGDLVLALRGRKKSLRVLLNITGQAKFLEENLSRGRIPHLPSHKKTTFLKRLFLIYSHSGNIILHNSPVPNFKDWMSPECVVCGPGTGQVRGGWPARGRTARSS